MRTSDLFENTCSASVKASSAQRVSGRMHIVSECTGSRLATASFVLAFASQAVPDIWKQLEAMEFKWIISKILLTLKSNLFP